MSTSSPHPDHRPASDETKAVAAPTEGPATPAEAPGESPKAAESTPQPRRVRRAPNFVPFLLTGALLGFVAGALVERFGLPFVGGVQEFHEQMTSSTYSATTSLGFLGVLGALFGVLVAAVVALVLDRRA